MRVLLDNLDLFAAAFLQTILLFVISGVGSLILGTILAALRVSPVPILRGFGTVYVNILRNTPLTLILFFFAFAYPRLKIVDLSFFTTAVIGLVLYTAAFVCEVVRSGVNTVPVGQAEAARAVGLTFGQTLGQIVVPQAIRSVVPPLSSVQIALLKNTTVASGFSVFQAGGLVYTLNEQGYASLPVLLWVALGFIILIVPLTLAQRSLEKRWSVAR